MDALKSWVRKDPAHRGLSILSNSAYNPKTNEMECTTTVMIANGNIRYPYVATGETSAEAQSSAIQLALSNLVSRSV